jgi:hypothetical protein
MASAKERKRRGQWRQVVQFGEREREKGAYTRIGLPVRRNNRSSQWPICQELLKATRGQLQTKLYFGNKHAFEDGM